VIHVPTAPWVHGIFDLFAWASGAILGRSLYVWRLKGVALQVARVTGPGYFLSLAGGAAGAAWISGSANTLRDGVPSLSHSILGALVGAIMGVELYKLAKGIRFSTGVIFVGPFALGAALGRWGCLFAGLPDRTYGTPTDLPWAVDLGDGIGRHPVQIYESLAMAAFLLVFLAGVAARTDWAMRRGFYLLCIWYGVQRFAWEFLKPYPRLVGPLNVFHLLCLGLVLYGGVFLVRYIRAERGDTLRAA
jgi:phosphatidylglycerol:prolipoprotein diacylglycerol transferase